MKLKALIFDVDGTLADTEEAHRCAFNQAFQQHGLDWHWRKPEYVRLLQTTGGKERLRAYVDSLGMRKAENRTISRLISAVHKTKTDNYIRMLCEGIVPLRDGVTRVLDEADRAGVRLAIASTTTLTNIDALLRTALGHGALERFSVVGAGDHVARKKPAPDIYEHVLRELKESAKGCVAIEDSTNGLKSARGAGLFTVVTPSYWTHGEDFAAADLLLPSLGTYDQPLLGIAELERRINTI
jgi:HAD superfamily hydrolase (TIGR01509 family)